MRQHGFFILIAVFIVVVMSFLGIIATYFVVNDMRTQTNTLSAEQALFIANAGIEASVHDLFNPVFANRIACTTVSGYGPLTNVTAPNTNGPFTVTATGPVIPTASTLNGALNATDTAIVLADASTYANSGRAMIDKELVSYMGVSGNTLLNVERGIDGTVAVAHANGAPVGQYLCMLNSEGGVTVLNPSGDTPGGMRTVQATASLPEAWAVGDASSGNAQFIFWNNPIEMQWNDSSLSGVNTTFNSVDWLSYADAWAVGDAGAIEHWMGNTWSASTSNTTQNLRGVSCTASNNCWAVGDNTLLLMATFDFWNGSTWALQTTVIPTTQFNSVFCNSSNDCWAVGNALVTDVFAHWNGTAWALDASAPTPIANLNSVTCVSSSDCWAVGAAATIVNWNGSSWSASSGTSGIPAVAYNGISCAASNDCWAVGNNASGSVAIHWNGSAWTQDTSAASAASVDLKDVSCAQSTDCWAVGANSTTLHWDGSSWTAITNTLPAGVTLNSVSAFSAGPFENPLSAMQEMFS